MKVITVSGDNLFTVALKYLGDATLWVQIAEVNGITDPWLSGLVTLDIPDPTGLLGGGVVQQ